MTTSTTTIYRAHRVLTMNPSRPEAMHVAVKDGRIKAAYWAATEPRCANQAFNITNGDYFRWCHLWPRIAAAFDMPSSGPQPLSLVEFMADKAPLWNAMVEKYGLQRYRFDEVVAWPFGDYVFGCNWDVMSSLTRARQFGFHDVLDSEQMFVALLGRFRTERIVP